MVLPAGDGVGGCEFEEWVGERESCCRSNCHRRPDGVGKESDNFLTSIENTTIRIIRGYRRISIRTASDSGHPSMNGGGRDIGNPLISADEYCRSTNATLASIVPTVAPVNFAKNPIVAGCEAGPVNVVVNA